jgi:AAT family amino acid transporter
MTDKAPPRELKRGLKARHVQLIALGGIIGSAYFLGTGALVRDNGPATVISYMLGGLLVYMVMVCLGELAANRPVEGSFVTYANEYVHPIVGCGVGWSYWLTWVAYVPSEMIAAGIVMHHFVPSVSELVWALLFGALITVTNLLYVGTFGEMEFWLALIKIFAIGMFVVLALFIWLGLGGDQEFVGTSIMLGQGGFFPHGVATIFLTMVIILVNFQGSEIIGIAAAESKDPAHAIPQAVRQVSYRIIALYVIPVMLLVGIIPYTDAGLNESVFAMALDRYGFRWAGAVFSFVVLTAAISCSNSGLYATSRAIFALSREGMAPRFLGRLNASGVPYNAILVSVLGCWLFLGLRALSGGAEVYEILLALSGFTGAIAWIAICWSQYNFRKRLRAQGDTSTLTFHAPGYPWFTLFAIWAQVACLVVVMFSPKLRIAAFLGVPLLLIPMLVYWMSGAFARRVARST